MSNACHTNKYNICTNDTDNHNILYNLKMMLCDKTITANKNKKVEKYCAIIQQIC